MEQKSFEEEDVEEMFEYLEGNIEEISYEEMEYFAPVQGNGKRSKRILYSMKDELENTGEEKKYFVGNTNKLVWDSFFEAWRREVKDERSSDYIDFAKKLLEETDTEITDLKIKNDENGGLKTDFSLKRGGRVVETYTVKQRQANIPAIFLFASLGSEKPRIEEDLLLSKEQLSDKGAFEAVEPENYELAELDLSKMELESSEVEENLYEDWKFKDYFRSEGKTQSNKYQKFLGFDVGRKGRYMPFTVGDTDEMLLKEFSKRKEDKITDIWKEWKDAGVDENILNMSTVKKEGLENIRNMDEVTLPAKILLKAHADEKTDFDINKDFEILTDLTRDSERRYDVIKIGSDEDIIEGITPYRPTNVYVRLGQDFCELDEHNRFIKSYVPRLKEGLKTNVGDSGRSMPYA